MHRMSSLGGRSLAHGGPGVAVIVLLEVSPTPISASLMHTHACAASPAPRPSAALEQLPRVTPCPRRSTPEGTSKALAQFTGHKSQAVSGNSQVTRRVLVASQALIAGVLRGGNQMSQVTSHKSMPATSHRVTSHESRVTSHKSQVTSHACHESRVTSHKSRRQAPPFPLRGGPEGVHPGNSLSLRLLLRLLLLGPRQLALEARQVLRGLPGNVVEAAHQLAYGPAQCGTTNSRLLPVLHSSKVEACLQQSSTVLVYLYNTVTEGDMSLTCMSCGRSPSHPATLTSWSYVSLDTSSVSPSPARAWEQQGRECKLTTGWASSRPSNPKHPQHATLGCVIVLAEACQNGRQASKPDL